jgi:hypothetical protein
MTTKFSKKPVMIGKCVYFGEHAEIIRMIWFYMYGKVIK